MSDPSILNSSRTIFTMHRLHAALDASVKLACDISIESAALLTDIAEQGSAGIPVKTIRERYQDILNPDWFIETLIQRELAQRVRNQNDRRSIAITITSKGKERLLITDDAIAQALLDLNSRMVEDDFVRLVRIAQDLAFRFNPKRQAVALFPAFQLRSICRYRQISISAAARYGMTSFQVAALMRLDGAPRDLDFEGAKRHFLYSNNLLEAQLAHMTEHGLIEEVNRVVLTELGANRRATLQKAFREALSPHFTNMPGAVIESLTEAAEFTNYLFS